MLQFFIIEKEPGSDEPFRAVFGPVSSQRLADSWKVLRLLDLEERGEARVVQVMGKSRLVRSQYSGSYDKVLQDVGFFQWDWEQFAERADPAMPGYAELREWYEQIQK